MGRTYSDNAQEDGDYVRAPVGSILPLENQQELITGNRNSEHDTQNFS
jgi:hypothetical protein